MIWVVVILAGLIAVPLTIEAMRTPMSEARQDKAPGQIALLSQGRTHYQWLGPERGPVAVCIHGLTTPSFVWRGLARGLALMGFRVLVYDHSGRGYSASASGRQGAAFFLTQYNDLLMHEDITDLQRAETDRRGYFPAVLSSLRGVLRAPLPEQHAAIAAADVPVLAIWGADDDVIALAGRDVLAEWNPNARHTVIDGAGHGLTYTHTDQVLDAIRASST